MVHPDNLVIGVWDAKRHGIYPRELSPTRITDIRKVTTIARDHFNAGRYHLAAPLFQWIADACRVRA